MKENKRGWIKYAVTALIGLGITYLVADKQGLLRAATLPMAASALSDGFFVPSVAFIGLGGLIAIAGTGFFDIFAYGFKSLLVLFTILKKPEDHESYYEYKMARAERREKPSNFILWVGLGFLAAAIICYVLYGMG